MLKYIFTNHLEDVIQLFVALYICARSTHIAWLAYVNSRIKNISETERNHESEHLALTSLSAFISFILSASYVGHLVISALHPVETSTIADFVNVTIKVFETFLLIGYAWILNHIGHEELIFSRKRKKSRQ